MYRLFPDGKYFVPPNPGPPICVNRVLFKKYGLEPR